MAPGIFNLHIKRGLPFRQKFTLKGDTNLAFDLTGCGAKAQIRREIGAPDPALLTFSTDDGTIVLDTTAGSVLLLASGTATLAITDGWDGVWDLLIIPPSLPVFSVLEGKVTFSGTVTRLP